MKLLAFSHHNPFVPSRARTVLRVARTLSAATLVIFTPLVGAAQSATPPELAPPPEPAPAAEGPPPDPAPASSPEAAASPDAAPSVEVAPTESEPEVPSEAGSEATKSPDESAPSEDETQSVKSEADAEESVEEKDEDTYDGPATVLGGSDDKIAIGGYGGITILGTSIDGQAAALVGGEGALLLDHRFAIGVAGRGLASEVGGLPFSNGDPSAMGLGYGGAVIRYHLVSERSPVAVSFGALVGAGGMTFLRKVGEYEFEYDDDPEDVDVFFVAEPSIQGHLYFTRWMRVGLNANYRFTEGVGRHGLSDRDLSGFAFGGHLQFGWF